MKFWPLVVALFLAFSSYIEMKFNQQQMRNDIEKLKETDQAQWQRIGDLMGE